MPPPAGARLPAAVRPSLIAWYTPAKGPKRARSPTSASLTARSRKAKAKAAAKAAATKVDPEVNVILPPPCILVS